MKRTNEQYATILSSILSYGSREKNERTGKFCTSLPGVTFQVDLHTNGLPVVALRKIYPKSFIAEQLWFLSGSDDIKWLSEKTKIWDAFAEPNGVVTSAYGMRWRRWFRDMGRGHYVDQIEVVLEKLKKDPSSRHGVIMMWDPRYDLIHKLKNVPCPYTFTLMIIGGRLHLHLTVRSNDMVLGFPTDAAGFALLQMIFAQELGIEPGIYTHSISNAHIYEDHIEAAKTMIGRTEFMEEPKPIFFDLPEGALQRATILDETLYKAINDSILSQYKPMAPIPNLLVSV